jgi:hypothetical protein
MIIVANIVFVMMILITSHTLSVEGSMLAWRRIRKLRVLIIINSWIFSEWIIVSMCVSCCSIWVSCIISLNCLPVTKSSSSSSGSCCGGCFLGGMVSGIEKHSSRWLGVSKEEPKVGGTTHSLKYLTPLLRVFYLCCRWQLVVVKVTRRAWGDYKGNLCCSREGVAWKVKYGG